jgi:UDP-N-acetylglucosamine:LPS N-acetylglucosamine transferase
MTASRHIMLAAGGTGGHVFPAIAVAEELMGRGYTVSLVTDARGTDIGNTLSGVEVHRISASGIRGGVVAKIRGVVAIGVGVVQARRLFRKFRPECIIGFGGYPSVPTMVAATSRGLPTIIHEQNAVLGRANRLVSKRVSTIAASFDETIGIDDEYSAKVIVTGNPVRATFSAARNQDYPQIRPNGEGVKILVLGGSRYACHAAPAVRDYTTMPARRYRQGPGEIRHRRDFCRIVHVLRRRAGPDGGCPYRDHPGRPISVSSATVDAPARHPCPLPACNGRPSDRECAVG